GIPDHGYFILGCYIFEIYDFYYEHTCIISIRRNVGIVVITVVPVIARIVITRIAIRAGIIINVLENVQVLQYVGIDSQIRIIGQVDRLITPRTHIALHLVDYGPGVIVSDYYSIIA